MADLGNCEVLVDVARNQSRFGDSGRVVRKATSAFLLVGGSSFDYSVTISTAGAHFCKADNQSGGVCKGNTYGKARKYGPVNRRDRNDPAQWCKHVAAALADTEAVAEAQEITAAAFGASLVPKVEAVAPVAVEAKPAPVVADAKARLAELEAEAAKLRASFEIGEKVAALVVEYGREAIEAALKLHTPPGKAA